MLVVITRCCGANTNSGRVTNVDSSWRCNGESSGTCGNPIELGFVCTRHETIRTSGDDNRMQSSTRLRSVIVDVISAS